MNDLSRNKIYPNLLGNKKSNKKPEAIKVTKNKINKIKLTPDAKTIINQVLNNNIDCPRSGCMTNNNITNDNKNNDSKDLL